MKRLLDWAWLFAVIAAAFGGLALAVPELSGIMGWNLLGVTFGFISGVAILAVAIMGLTKIPFSEML